MGGVCNGDCGGSGGGTMNKSMFGLFRYIVRTTQTSKIEHFAELVNGFKPYIS